MRVKEEKGVVLEEKLEILTEEETTQRGIGLLHHSRGKLVKGMPLTKFTPTQPWNFFGDDDWQRIYKDMRKHTCRGGKGVVEKFGELRRSLPECGADINSGEWDANTASNCEYPLHVWASKIQLPGLHHNPYGVALEVDFYIPAQGEKQSERNMLVRSQLKVECMRVREDDKHKEGVCPLQADGIFGLIEQQGIEGTELMRTKDTLWGNDRVRKLVFAPFSRLEGVVQRFNELFAVVGIEGCKDLHNIVRIITQYTEGPDPLDTIHRNIWCPDEKEPPLCGEMKNMLVEYLNTLRSQYMKKLLSTRRE